MRKGPPAPEADAMSFPSYSNALPSILPALAADWLRYRSERREMMRLDSRTLRDIGVDAAEVYCRYGSFRRWRAWAGVTRRLSGRPGTEPLQDKLAQHGCRG